MSIPPLVCSTPPPLDQCEEDKDIEEFDLQYRLSQEDDEENNVYDSYGNFSTFSNYNPDISISEDQKCVSMGTKLNEIDDHTTTIPIPDNLPDKDDIKLKYDEVTIEDLNLEIVQENIDSENLVTDHLNNQDDADIYGIPCFVNHTDSSDKDLATDNSILVSNNDDVEIDNKKNICETNTSHVDVEVQKDITAKINIEINQVGDTDITLNVDPSSRVELKKPELETKVIDDFGDFEDFKFNSPGNYDFIESDENPWETKNAKDISCGDFKANFEFSDSKCQPVEGNESIDPEAPIATDLDIDDDFGDFDDFKSSAVNEAVEKPIDEQISPNVSVLNLQCNDSEAQIVENINNILFNIFTVDLPDSETISEKNLDILLGETWHHLKEVDVRQPYVVYWNNSLGQKTLLKALCIDSRNILFGPKWSYFTPKYATNLSMAPLKPQKSAPIPEPPQHSDTTNSGKTSKENTTWTDPFTSDGQEYTYAEALLLDLEHLMATLDQMAHKQSNLKISDLLSNASSTDKEKAFKESRPADLAVFGNSISITNLGKIHSSTLSVQPLRHINLPDTHIFTPTDSETPRSKTIHYDNGPPVLTPQQILDKEHIQPDKSVEQHTNLENTDDYWEFQDFKGVPSNVEGTKEPVKANEKIKATITDDSSTNEVISHQIQILQPVKVEPIIPALNWPDPGEVKETFDDFSDFILRSNWNDDYRNTTAANNVNEAKPSENNIDDEFETFQSAPLPASVNNRLDSADNMQINCSISNKLGDVNSINDQMDTLNLKTYETLSQSPIQKHTIIKNNPAVVSSRPSTSSTNNTSILKPINSGATSVIRAQQVGQILHPLSLESYSQISWPKPGIDLQNLSSFNPLESVQALKSDSGSSNTSKGASPVHHKINSIQNDISDDDIWGDFVSSKPKHTAPKKLPIFADDDEWTDFVSSPSISQNSLNTISFNVQTNSHVQKSSNLSSASKSNQLPLDIPALNYITPKSNNHGAYIEKHFQNL